MSGIDFFFILVWFQFGFSKKKLDSVHNEFGSVRFEKMQFSSDIMVM